MKGRKPGRIKVSAMTTPGRKLRPWAHRHDCFPYLLLAPHNRLLRASLLLERGSQFFSRDTLFTGGSYRLINAGCTTFKKALCPPHGNGQSPPWGAGAALGGAWLAEGVRWNMATIPPDIIIHTTASAEIWKPLR